MAFTFLTATPTSVLPWYTFAPAEASERRPPIRIGIAGLTHTHVHWILGRPPRGDIEIVGIAEANRELAERYAAQHGYSMDLVFGSLNEMLDAAKPDAVVAFNPIREHLDVVRKCAPRGVHVMVEKPLAVSFAHAREMAALAETHGIHLLTNYETTWYATTHKSYALVHRDSAVGEIRKMVIHDGHRGPAEIGVNAEFLEWLTDPEQNGGGAITDFGCYGVNLATWLMRGARPEKVVAVTQTIKPERYPRVDDEATIVLQYPNAQAIIQASWNWPFSRKDMQIYGTAGTVFADDGSNLRVRLDEKQPARHSALPPLQAPLDDPFAYFAARIHGDVTPGPFDLSSIENNLLVMEILDAAIRSARTGKAVPLESSGQK